MGICKRCNAFFVVNMGEKKNQHVNDYKCGLLIWLFLSTFVLRSLHLLGKGGKVEFIYLFIYFI